MPYHHTDRANQSALVHRIIAEIDRTGPITFARFMEISLYDPQDGYYMTARESPEGPHQRIGWQGDFYTAPELSPLLARTLVKQVLEIDSHNIDKANLIYQD